ncbi:transposase [Paraburkholderia phymatum]|uniref:IS200/IS605 family accessory protein TnpB-related protein n=1 Tax=Paraburkholderia phymatum TaxID=148447 RepID=UPI00317AA1AC
MTDPRCYTYQSRPVVSVAQAAWLDGYAALYGRAERSLFAALQAGGKDVNTIKREFLLRFGLTARQFNAMRIGLQGKVDSIDALRSERVAGLNKQIRRAATYVGKLEKSAPGTSKLHQKRRRLGILQAKLEQIQTDQKTGHVRLCFGSRKLFRAQFALAQNGYTSHAEWKADWQARRDAQFFVLGSKDETAGNQSCQASLEEDGTLTLKLRLPDRLTAAGKYITLPGVRFAYGHQDVVTALLSSQRVQSGTKDGKPVYRRTGTAVSYRFVRDGKGWRVFASVDVSAPARTSRRQCGAIGVDINADHLALAELDASGNLVRTLRLDLATYGKTTAQAEAMIGDACVAIAELARAAGKPVVHEMLDFTRKKPELEVTGARYARMLSSLSYRKLMAGIDSACFRRGVETIAVNPAYTSVIGAVNHAKRRGISIHMGAACAIARRGLGLSERLAVRSGQVPAHCGGHVTFVLPERNRAKHVWSLWAGVKRSLKAAHAAHLRSERERARGGSRSAPLAPATRPVGAIRTSGVRSPGANRHQHCSGGV